MNTKTYPIPKCPRCGCKAKLEYNAEVGYWTQSRVRCTACGRRTAWRPTRFQAEIEWEDETA